MTDSYELLRPLLFRLEPERAHCVAMSLYGLQSRLTPTPAPKGSQVVAGRLRFRNRVGLAAGFDKNGTYIDLAARMGFGFVEVGTITPRPQAGNPHPRIFRYPDAKAIVNRMGFPNDGVEAVSMRAEHRRSSITLGANISKNFDTPLSSAVDDFVECFRRVRAWADYVVINVSSPNTPGLRDLQSAAFLDELCSALRAEESSLPTYNGEEMPLLLKISPDLSDMQLQQLAELVRRSRIDGVIATNTTTDRTQDGASFKENGGISGAPLFARSLRCICALRQYLGSEALLVGCGGIMSAEHAKQMREAGADVVQIYTGLIYRGPRIVTEVASALA